MKPEYVYGRTPMGQLLYDLAFAKITEKWIARKHHLPIAKVRHLKDVALNNLKQKKRRK